ncbi:BREX-1 system adenine-specific DNA-methyltransferase PglX [candidate division KSB1 bacterium]|nr:BREX-1 system adenine-specific DNA-methyltransferase PglX [candidate division KSB1 bacterium]
MKSELKSAVRTTVQKARELLLREAAEQLESIYGYHRDGSGETVDNLPETQKDPVKQKTLLLLIQFFKEEEKSGLNAADAVQKLIREIAFTHLNRLVAFKMMEARKILRGTVDKGPDSNGFKFYLAEHEDDLKLFETGGTDTAYRNFLLWQCGQIAEKDHLEVLFDPGNLPSKMFPRPTTLNKLLELLNAENLEPVWQQDETIGWVYQYFIEEDKDRVFHKIYKQKKKMELRDIPAATQIFTPRWIVLYLVENTLGRMWLRMHPDSRLAEKMRYYVPNHYNDKEPLPLKPVREITLLDPACGTMHFGLAVFDLFYAMYREELENAGHDGWPTGEQSAVSSEQEIPVKIIENNIYGIDIDLRAIQLSALTLYLKVKSMNKDAKISRLNLTYTDIPPIAEDEMENFIASLELKHPVAGELLAKILPELNKAYYLGSLLKIEDVVRSFIKDKKTAFKKQMPQLPGMDAETEPASWYQVHDEILNGLRKMVSSRSNGKSLIAGEAIQGLGLIDALIQKHDIVVANPPFSGRRNWGNNYAKILKTYYPLNSSDMYSAFIERFKNLVKPEGLVGFVTSHTFMFTSSYENLRKMLITETSLQTILHVGNLSEFDSGGRIEGALAFVAMAFQNTSSNKDKKIINFRLVADKDYLKISNFQSALADWQTHGEAATDRHVFVVRQEDFKAIPGWPLVYWVSEGIRKVFYENKIIWNYNKKTGLAEPRLGMATGDNNRFIRYWWEIILKKIPKQSIHITQTFQKNMIWYPYMKGGDYNKWFGNQDNIIKWLMDGIECKSTKKGDRIISHNYNGEYSFKEGATYSFLTVSNLNVRYLPPGFIFDVAGSSIFPKEGNPLFIIALLNSKISTFLIKLLNPTVNYQVGDIARLPYPDTDNYQILKDTVEQKTQTCIHSKRRLINLSPVTWEFSLPADWENGLQEQVILDFKLTTLENDISEACYILYGVSTEDITRIEEDFGILPGRLPGAEAAELNTAVKKIKTYYLDKHIPEEALKSGTEQISDEKETENETKKSRRMSRYLNFEEVCLASGYHPDTVYQVISDNRWQRPEERFELAYNWLEYAIGILMGRFSPGIKGELGSAVIHKNDFITGSLTITDEEFEEISKYFPVSYTEESGKHAFSKELEQQLCALADPDGIMVLDEGHKDDLPARIDDVLSMMLGEKQSREVLATLIGEAKPDREKFRRFMERDFFSKHHLKMYRKRPIYWLLQTGGKNYGFYIFHERFDKDTLYKLQRNYIDPKLKLVDMQIKDKTRNLLNLSGSEQRAAKREIEDLQDLYQEIREFTEKLTAVLNKTDENGRVVGYDPDINDGVIINMAPLRELIPWNEPAKYWQELEQGQYDWARLAMRYWPDRVTEKCKKDKSLAIAHEIEDIYQGGK